MATYPEATGSGGWYRLSDGTKIQGSAKANAAQEALNEAAETELAPVPTEETDVVLNQKTDSAEAVISTKTRTNEMDDLGRRPQDSDIPGGRKKALIPLRDYQVWPTDKSSEKMTVTQVPGPGFAVREYVLFKNIKHTYGKRFRTALVKGSERHAGEKGYGSTIRDRRKVRLIQEAHPEPEDAETGLELVEN